MASISILFEPVSYVSFRGLGDFTPFARGPANIGRVIESAIPPQTTLVGALTTYLTQVLECKKVSETLSECKREETDVDICEFYGCWADALVSVGIKRVVAPYIVVEGREGRRVFVQAPNILLSKDYGGNAKVVRLVKSRECLNDTAKVYLGENGVFNAIILEADKDGKDWNFVDNAYIDIETLKEIIAKGEKVVESGCCERIGEIVKPHKLFRKESRVRIALDREANVASKRVAEGYLFERSYLMLGDAKNRVRIGLELELAQDAEKLPNRKGVVRFGGGGAPAIVEYVKEAPITSLAKYVERYVSGSRYVAIYFLTPAIVSVGDGTYGKIVSTLERSYEFKGCRVITLRVSETVIGRFNPVYKRIERFVVLEPGSTIILECGGGFRGDVVGSLNFLPSRSDAFSVLGFGTYLVLPLR